MNWIESLNFRLKKHETLKYIKIINAMFMIQKVIISELPSKYWNFIVSHSQFLTDDFLIITSEIIPSKNIWTKLKILFFFQLRFINSRHNEQRLVGEYRFSWLWLTGFLSGGHPGGSPRRADHNHQKRISKWNSKQNCLHHYQVMFSDVLKMFSKL